MYKIYNAVSFDTGSKRKIWLSLVGLLLIVLFRLLYGVSKFSGQDEFQVYLIGLKYYTSGVLPYWGPDVVFTQTRIPGSLQGLLVGLPFFVLPQPESPYVLLNLLSFLALLLLAWYLGQRIPALPKWCIYAWLLTAPWTLHFSTHIENPSYVLFGAVLFFVAIWELFPIYERPLISYKTAFFLIGFSLLWVFQLHLSWVLMLPYVGLAGWFWRKRLGALLKGTGFMLLGMAVSGSALTPLFVNIGWGFPNSTGQNMALNLSNLKHAPTILFRFLSFSSYEVTRFMGAGNMERLDFLKENTWAIPVVAFLFVVGILQVIWLCWSFFKPLSIPVWKMVRKFALGSVLLVVTSFCFTGVLPAAHTYYLLLPVSMWYGFHCYATLAEHPRFKTVAVVTLAAGLLFQSVLVYRNLERIGLYKDRFRICKAMENKDYTLLGLRREALFEQQRIGDTWEKTIVSTAATSLGYFNGFERYNAHFCPQNIVSTEYFTGQHACKLDSIQPYALDFHVKTGETQVGQKLFVTFQLKSKGYVKPLLVADVKKNGERLFWGSQPVPTPSGTTTAVWQPVQMELELPVGLMPDADLYVYFWCPEKISGIAYIDDVRIGMGEGSGR